MYLRTTYFRTVHVVYVYKSCTAVHVYVRSDKNKKVLGPPWLYTYTCTRTRTFHIIINFYYHIYEGINSSPLYYEVDCHRYHILYTTTFILYRIHVWNEDYPINISLISCCMCTTDVGLQGLSTVRWGYGGRCVVFLLKVKSQYVYKIGTASHSVHVVMYCCTYR
jgi:hypothetical protein